MLNSFQHPIGILKQVQDDKLFAVAETSFVNRSRLALITLSLFWLCDRGSGKVVAENGLEV